MENGPLASIAAPCFKQAVQWAQILPSGGWEAPRDETGSCLAQSRQTPHEALFAHSLFAPPPTCLFPPPHLLQPQCPPTPHLLSSLCRLTSTLFLLVLCFYFSTFFGLLPFLFLTQPGPFFPFARHTSPPLVATSPPPFLKLRFFCVSPQLSLGPFLPPRYLGQRV